MLVQLVGIEHVFGYDSRQVDEKNPPDKHEYCMQMNGRKVTRTWHMFEFIIASGRLKARARLHAIVERRAHVDFEKPQVG